MTNLNPYQSPTVVDPTINPVSAGATITDRFDEKQRSLLLAALKLVNHGHLVVMASAILFGLSVAFRTSGPLAADSVNGAIVLFGVGSGLLVKLLGVSAWCSLSGPEKAFSILAMTLQVLAMFATGIFVIATLNGRFVGGLFPLFGASAFAMLLISQAIIALVNRSWALSLRDKIGTRSSELAVIGYAVCASLCAANSMKMISQKGHLTAVVFMTLVAGITALVLQMIALHQTHRALKMANSRDVNFSGPTE